MAAEVLEAGKNILRDDSLMLGNLFAVFRFILRISTILVTMVFGSLLICLLLLDELPLGTISRRLVAAPSFSILDMHTHVAGIGKNSDCFISDRMRESFKFPIYLRVLGVSLEEIEEHGDQLAAQRLSEKVRASQHVSEAVLLAMDGVIDASGKLDREQTEIYVPNSFVKEQTERFDNLLYGASINPYRPDAIERLEQAKADGALLIKWIPAIMKINPGDPRLEPFYTRMKELNIPLLSHAGDEASFTTADNSLGDPLLLELPLRIGVTVIAAHISTTGEQNGQEQFHRIMPLFERYENLYTDISSLTQINKLGYLAEALQQSNLLSRMIYGSDYPLPFFPLVSPWYHLPHISAADARYIHNMENLFDKDVSLKMAFGVPNDVFTRSATLLKNRAPMEKSAELELMPGSKQATLRRPSN